MKLAGVREGECLWAQVLEDHKDAICPIFYSGK